MFLPRPISSMWKSNTLLCRWKNFEETLNVSSFFDCFRNTDVPNWFPEARNLLKKLSIYAGTPQLVDDVFEYIVRRSKFMVQKCSNLNQLVDLL